MTKRENLTRHFLLRGNLVRRTIDTIQRWWKYRQEDRDLQWKAGRDLEADLRADMLASFKRNGITDI